LQGGGKKSENFDALGQFQLVVVQQEIVQAVVDVIRYFLKFFLCWVSFVRKRFLPHLINLVSFPEIMGSFVQFVYSHFVEDIVGVLAELVFQFASE
jgi:hypothetical protein